MAKLFKTEKEMRDLIYVLRLNIPYGFTFDNPYSSINFEEKLNYNTTINYSFDFFHYGDNNYFKLTIFIGSRCYTGLFYYEDYKFIFELVNKFININTEVSNGKNTSSSKQNQKSYC